MLSCLFGNLSLHQTLQPPWLLFFEIKCLTDPARLKTSIGNSTMCKMRWISCFLWFRKLYIQSILNCYCSGLVYIRSCNVLYISVCCTCVCVCNRACYWALSPACWSVRRNGLQALHLHPGVTDSSLYLCLFKQLSSHHTHFITLIPSPPVSMGQWLRMESRGKREG